MGRGQGQTQVAATGRFAAGAGRRGETVGSLTGVVEIAPPPVDVASVFAPSNRPDAAWGPAAAAGLRSVAERRGLDVVELSARRMHAVMSDPELMDDYLRYLDEQPDEDHMAEYRAVEERLDRNAQARVDAKHLSRVFAARVVNTGRRLNWEIEYGGAKARELYRRPTPRWLGGSGVRSARGLSRAPGSAGAGGVFGTPGRTNANGLHRLLHEPLLDASAGEAGLGEGLQTLHHAITLGVIGSLLGDGLFAIFDLLDERNA